MTGLSATGAFTNAQPVEADVVSLVSDLAGKQATGNYITSTTGDVVATGPGSVPAIIQASAVTTTKIAANAATYAKLQQGSGLTVLGVAGTSTTNYSEITATGGTQCLQTNSGGTAVVWAACPTSGGGGSVTNVSGTPGQVNVVNNTTTPVISLPNVGPGATTTGSAGIASVTTDAQGRLVSAATATYLTSTGTTPGGYNSLMVTSDGLINGASVTSWMTAGAIMKSGGLAALPVAASSGDIAAAIGMPTAGQVDISGGTGSAPIGDSTFTFDTSTHTESVHSLTVGFNLNLALASQGVATVDASGFIGGTPQPVIADYDWSVAFVNSATGLVDNSGAFLIPSGDYGATIETSDSLIPGGTNAGNALAGVYATTRMPLLQDVTQAFRGGVFSCSLWYGQQSGTGSSTVEYDLAYSTNPSTGSSTSHVLSSIVTTNVGSVLQNLGTNTFSTSVPAGSYLYVAIYRTDANGAMAVLNLNARCKAELYK